MLFSLNPKEKCNLDLIVLSIVLVCLLGIVIMSAAVHRMHLEIVSGRALYTECQHRRELFRRSVASEISQVISFTFVLLY